jgi:hypothetical protein
MTNTRACFQHNGAIVTHEIGRWIRCVVDEQGHRGDTSTIAGIVGREPTDGGPIKLVTTRGELNCLSRQPLHGRDAARESNV